MTSINMATVTGLEPAIFSFRAFQRDFRYFSRGLQDVSDELLGTFQCRAFQKVIGHFWKVSDAFGGFRGFRWFHVVLYGLFVTVN